MEAAFYRLSIRRVNAKLDVWSNGRPHSGALGKGPDDDPDFDFSHYRCPADLTGSRRVVKHRASRETA